MYTCRHTYMKCQPINLEEIMELENHHFAGVTAITDSSKNHQCMLRRLGERLKKKYLQRLTVSHHKLFTNYKRENSNLTLRTRKTPL